MRVAVCQMNAGGGDVQENVATAVRLLGEAGAAGADLAALPELWAAHGSPVRMRESAAPIPGPLTDAVAEIARARSMWIVGGSVAEAADDHVFNTSCLFDRDGEIVARYRKIHLFDVDLPGQPPLRESVVFAAGGELGTRDPRRVAGRMGTRSWSIRGARCSSAPRRRETACGSPSSTWRASSGSDRRSRRCSIDGWGPSADAQGAPGRVRARRRPGSR